MDFIKFALNISIQREVTFHRFMWYWLCGKDVSAEEIRCVFDNNQVIILLISS